GPGRPEVSGDSTRVRLLRAKCHSLPWRLAERRPVEPQENAERGTGACPLLSADRACGIAQGQGSRIRRAMDTREVLPGILHPGEGVLRRHLRTQPALVGVVDDGHLREVENFPSGTLE